MRLVIAGLVCQGWRAVFVENRDEASPVVSLICGLNGHVIASPTTWIQEVRL